MGYLFADSEPFPLTFDFLATLRAIVKAASQTFGHLSEVERLRAEIEERNQGTQEVLAALANFAEALEAARAAAEQHFADVEPVLAYSQDLKAHLEQTGARAREVHARSNDELNQKALAEIEANQKGMRGVVEEFLLAARLHLELAYSRVTLKDDGSYDLVVGAWTQGNLEIDYGVTTDRAPEWKEPRRVDALVKDLILQVGMKKKFLRKDLTRELIDVSDYVIGQATIYPLGGEIQLRRKASSTKDQIVVTMRRDDAGLHAEVSRPDEGGQAFAAGPGELERIEKLRAALDGAAREMLSKHTSVRGVRLDGNDIFTNEQEPRLFDRLIELYAPLVHEIARRSPSPRELSLKLQRDDGRREELFVTKAELAAEFSSLTPEKRRHFDPLGLA